MPCNKETKTRTKVLAGFACRPKEEWPKEINNLRLSERLKFEEPSGRDTVQGRKDNGCQEDHSLDAICWGRC